MRFILFVSFFLLTHTIFSQEKNAQIIGCIVADKNQALEGAYVSIFNGKDKKQLRYTFSDKSGCFNIMVPDSAENVLLQIDYQGYQRYLLELSIQKK